MPGGGEEGPGWCHSRRLLVASLLLSLFSVVISVLFTVIVLTRPANTQVLARLEDLEAELDLLMEDVEVRRVSPVCSLSPDPGPCTSSVRRYYYLPRYY